MSGNETMESILTQWGFPELRELFAEQEIDEIALMDLDANTVKELIPKVGPRVKFLQKLQIFQTLNKMEVIIKDDSTSGAVSNPNVLIVDDNSSLCDTSSVSNTSVELEPDIRPSTQILNSNDEAATAFKLATRHEYAFIGADMLASACRKSYNLNLKEFLNLTNAGRYVLATYKTEHMLSRKARNTLVDLLINGIMSECSGNLTSEDFQNLSRKICGLFETENEGTYYIARVSQKQSVKSKSVNAKGKLIDKYRNLKRMYANNRKAEETTKNDAITATVTSADVENSALWLKHYTEPWDLVLSNWKNTFTLRRSCQVITVQQFIDNWPILKHSNACSLIEHDFNQMYPTSVMNLYTKWESFFNKLHSLKPAVDKVTEELLINLAMDLGEDSRNALKISALASLFPPKGRIRNKNVHWKPSILEAQESLINHIKIPGEIENFIDNKKTQYQQQKRNIQPYMIVVGPSITDITESYLIIDNLMYKCTSVLQCFDLLFKLYHVLCAEYPRESEHIWLLIQHSIYNVSTQWDKQIPYVLSLVNDLKSEF